MTFVKGVSGNLKGKPKGTISKITKLKNELLDMGFERIEEIRKMPIKDLVKCICSIMPKDINIDVDNKQMIININKTISDKPTIPKYNNSNKLDDDIEDAEVIGD